MQFQSRLRFVVIRSVLTNPVGEVKQSAVEISNPCERFEHLEQYFKLNNLEIQGVPEKSNENIYKIIENIVYRYCAQGTTPDIV